MTKVWKVIVAVGIAVLALLAFLASGSGSGARLQAYLKKRDAEQKNDEARERADTEKLEGAADKVNEEANDASHDSASAADAIGRATRP